MMAKPSLLSFRRLPMEHHRIHFRAELTIEAGKIDEFKALVQEMSQVVEANEPETIQYESMEMLGIRPRQAPLRLPCQDTIA